MTIFVVQPIGGLPEGKTLIISRMAGSKLIDSADAVCARFQPGEYRGSVTLLCRGAILRTVTERATIYARLPYSEWLYLRSTGGKRYSR